MAGSKSTRKAASASTPRQPAARPAPHRPSKTVGVLNQAALDEAVAKAIAPLAQRVEDMQAAVTQLGALHQRTSEFTAITQRLDELLATATATSQGRNRWMPWRRARPDSSALELELDPTRALPTATQ